MKRILMILLAMNSLNCFSQTGDPFLDNLLKTPNMPEPVDFSRGIPTPTLKNYNEVMPNFSTVQQQNAYLLNRRQ